MFGLLEDLNSSLNLRIDVMSPDIEVIRLDATDHDIEISDRARKRILRDRYLNATTHGAELDAAPSSSHWRVDGARDKAVLLLLTANSAHNALLGSRSCSRERSIFLL